MTVPAIPFKFSSIQAEFGSNMPTTATNALAYKKWYSTSTGGYYVGATNSTTNVSTSTPFALSTFAGSAATYIINTVTYTAATTTFETIPSGVKSVTIEIWGGGGPGGGSTTGPPGAAGGGGGSGGYSSSTYAISGTNWGQTFSVRIGPVPNGGVFPGAATPGSATTVTNGTFNVPFTMIAPGGGAGGVAPTGTAGAAGAIGTGGQVNKVGNIGTAGGGTVPAPGGAGVAGIYGTGNAGGPAIYPTNGAVGGNPKVIFRYS
jgi:hypothetical protein